MFSPQALLAQLAPCMQAPVWWLGLSGGLDSMALLEALVQIRRTQQLPPIQAIHIHHGLHPEADRWAAHCQRECDARQIPLIIRRVTVAGQASLEDAARAARYQAFSDQLGSGHCLLLAHHRDDQLETLLFRIFRGTGMRGLTGMPVRRALGAGFLLRPLLGWSRSELQHWAGASGLSWIEDPANTDDRFARTVLRHQLLPLLRQQWPAADNSLLRLAEHAGEANDLLDERAAEDLGMSEGGVLDSWAAGWPSLDLAHVLTLSLPRQSNLLRYWLMRQGCRLPDHRQLRTVLAQLPAASDSQPMMMVDEYRLCRSSGRLWLLPREGVPKGISQAVEGTGEISLIGGNGKLRIESGEGGILWRPGSWRIEYRQGGEMIQLKNRPRRALKQLFQEAAVPFWLRPAVPLLYCDDRLVSVAGRWSAEEVMAGQGESGWRISWEPVEPGLTAKS